MRRTLEQLLADEKSSRDLKLSTLKRYVEATGSKLRLDVELPDGFHYEFTL